MLINPDTTLLPRLPEGAVPFLGEAHVQLAIYRQTRYHWCPVCDGWVAGDPITTFEHEHGNLCGRHGTSYHCRRCRTELGFIGCYF
jgi:hypothetical protein